MFSSCVPLVNRRLLKPLIDKRLIVVAPIKIVILMIQQLENLSASVIEKMPGEKGR